MPEEQWPPPRRISKRKKYDWQAQCQGRDARVINIDHIIAHVIVHVTPTTETQGVPFYAGIGSYVYLDSSGCDNWRWCIFIKDWWKDQYDWRGWFVGTNTGITIQRYLVDGHSTWECLIPNLFRFKFLRDIAYRKRMFYWLPPICSGDGDLKIVENVNGKERWFNQTMYTMWFTARKCPDILQPLSPRTNANMHSYACYKQRPSTHIIRLNVEDL